MATTAQWEKQLISKLIDVFGVSESQAKKLINTGEGAKSTVARGDAGSRYKSQWERTLAEAEQAGGFKKLLDKYANKEGTAFARLGGGDYDRAVSYLVDDALTSYRQEVTYPELYKKGNEPTQGLTQEYMNWRDNYETTGKNEADLKINEQLELGNYKKAQELINQYKSDYRGLDFSSYETRASEGISTQQKQASDYQAQIDAAKKAEEDLRLKQQNDLTSSQMRQTLETLGGGADTISKYREELLKTPELEQMSPEYAQYLKTTLDSIEKANQETIRSIETGASAAGLSAYAQRAVTQATQTNTLGKAQTEAELRLQDLNSRMEKLNTAEQQRRSFLENEYNTMRNYGMQLSELEQRRAWETEDQYKSRLQQIQDTLQQRGWNEQDLNQARNWQIADTYRARGWQTQDESTRRLQALEDYERQKNDYMNMLNMTKTKDTPWWQKAVGGVATAVGTALGGGIGGAIGTGVGSLFGNNQQTLGQSSNPFLNMGNYSQSPLNYNYTNPVSSYLPQVNYGGSYNSGYANTNNLFRQTNPGYNANLGF